MLLASSQDEQEEAVEIKDVSEHLQPTCSAYDELLDVMSCTTDRLDLPWKHEKRKLPRSCLNECLVLGHNCPTRTCCPFLPDIHTSHIFKEKNFLLDVLVST